MRLISVAAPLIRRAAADEYHAQKLFAAVEDERDASGSGRVLSELIQEPAVEEEDLSALTPAEWRWYSSWKQALGGRLEETVLNYLADCATTRFARYQVRALVLRDPDTNAEALRAAERPDVIGDSIGLTWLRAQAQGSRVTRMLTAQYARMLQALEAGARAEVPVAESDALVEEVRELTQDALQCGGNASTFLLTELQALDNDELVAAVFVHIDAFVSQRGFISENTARWYGRGEPVGG